MQFTSLVILHTTFALWHFVRRELYQWLWSTMLVLWRECPSWLCMQFTSLALLHATFALWSFERRECYLGHHCLSEVLRYPFYSLWKDYSLIHSILSMHGMYWWILGSETAMTYLPFPSFEGRNKLNCTTTQVSPHQKLLVDFYSPKCGACLGELAFLTAAIGISTSAFILGHQIWS